MRRSHSSQNVRSRRNSSNNPTPQTGNTACQAIAADGTCLGEEVDSIEVEVENDADYEIRHTISKFICPKQCVRDKRGACRRIVDSKA